MGKHRFQSIRFKILAGFLLIVGIFTLGGGFILYQERSVTNLTRTFLDEYWTSTDMLMETNILMNRFGRTIVTPPNDIDVTAFLGKVNEFVDTQRQKFEHSALAPEQIRAISQGLDEVRESMKAPLELHFIPGEKMEQADAAVTPVLDQARRLGDETLVNELWELVMTFNDILITEDPALRNEFKRLASKIRTHDSFSSFAAQFNQLEQMGLAVFDAKIAEHDALAAYRSKTENLFKLLAGTEETFGANVLEPAQASLMRKLASMAWIILLIIGLSALCAVGLGLWMSGKLTAPLLRTVKMLKEIELGHLENRLNLKLEDEIGQMAASLDAVADCLEHEMVGSLEKLAAGDLTFDVQPRDNRDRVRGAIRKLGKDLNVVMEKIHIAGEQIAAGSAQVSDSSQSLSQGATESASSLEEISASLNEMTGQVRQNAENANQANGLSDEAQNAAEKGNAQMQEMVAAMGEIAEAGQNISKIIKVIDEIAFQTNLLALNAAVEAARAGQHGKGFAVVAEEVRNLAGRSARAARETAELIESSVTLTEKGSGIATQTAEALGEIVRGVTRVSDLVAEIAAASNEQAQGIVQVNQGLTQIDQVTQQNTANAEESAAASEELSSQAAQLRQMLARFTLKGPTGTSQVTPPPPGALEPQVPDPTSWGENQPEPQYAIALDDSEFGRY